MQLHMHHAYDLASVTQLGTSKFNTTCHKTTRTTCHAYSPCARVSGAADLTLAISAAFHADH